MTDEGLVVSDGHILFAWPKRIWKEKSTKEGIKAPLWKLPKWGVEKYIVPHNGRLNLRVHPSISAQDAAALSCLFGSTGNDPRDISAFKGSGVKKMCRWHIFSQDRSGYAARREVTGRRGRRPLRGRKEYGK